MKEARALKQRFGAPLGASALLLIGLVLAGGCDREEIVAAARADVLVIDAMQAFGALERPAVPFPHDLHTAALAGDGEGCVRCHFEDEGKRPLPLFKRKVTADRDAVLDVYHGECIGCHEDRAGDGLATGPVTCGECHAIEPGIVPAQELIAFDNSLHARHTKAHNDKCATCHRVYEEGQKPSSCRDCHGAEATETMASMRSVAHADCIGCHLKKKSGSGPVDCAGCHDAGRIGGVETLAEIPRLDAGQPDAVLLEPGGTGDGAGRMATVPFDHKTHETACASCRTCHHESLRACGECHTMKGSPEGAGVTLQDAMHDPASQHSCLGCHGAKKSKAACASCHAAIDRSALPEDSCAFCHNGPPAGSEGAMTLPAKTVASGFSLPAGEIPQTITIDRLSDRFGPASFPHGKIIEQLRAGAAKSGVALHFHGSEDTLCAGCHHHSPAGQKPPLCGSCHGKPFDERSLHMPGLVGAYHLQCMGCHVEMKLDTLLSCTACHAEKTPEKSLPAAKEEK